MTPSVSRSVFFLSFALLMGCRSDDSTIKDTGPLTLDTAQEVDADGDGYTTATDCDDGDASVYPGADELCNGADDDCDGEVDEDSADSATWYADTDGDGYGDPEQGVDACEAPSGTVADASDCDDAQASVHPGADEYCDGQDDDCDGTTDEGDAVDALTWYADADGDGFGDGGSTTSACAQPSGYLADASDCDDGAASINPDAMEVYDGADDNCDGDVDFLDLSRADLKLLGEGYGDRAGQAVAWADTDGDGVHELVISTPYEDGTATDAGAVYLLQGPLSGEVSLSATDAMLLGEASGDRAGYDVANAGDVDGDGLDDLLIGAQDEDSGGTDAGAAYLVLGPISGTWDLGAADALLMGEAAADAVGTAVDSAGDVDGDGLADLLIGAPYEDSNGSSAGVVYLVSGTPSGVVDLGSATARLYGVSAGDQAGRDVAAAGDVDGDGYDDVLIGAFGEDSGGSYAGSGYLVYGPVSGDMDLDVADAVLVGESAQDYAGKAVAGGSDCNGDGYDDVLIGAHGQDGGGSMAGAAYLVLGPISGSVDLSAADATLTGELASDNAGRPVAMGGDMNGDGYDELLIGAYYESSGGSQAGVAYVVAGPVTGAVDLSVATIALVGETAGDYAGWSLAGRGDGDGDGLDDLLVGALYDDTAAYNAGAVYVLWGRPF